jgi:hypothetical protein
MNKHIDLTFCCQNEDKLAVIALSHLASLTLEDKKTKRFTVVFLQQDQTAPAGSIAFYTGYNESWGSRWLRVAAHRLYEGRPLWAITTPFVVSVKNVHEPTGESLFNFKKAAEELANIYVKWYQGEAGVDLPWETPKGAHTTYSELMEEWFDLVGAYLGAEALQQLLAMQKRTKDIAGRGGDIVYNHLVNTGRVVLSAEDIPVTLRPNTSYKNLTGIIGTIVSYGTSDLANVFELLQAIKLGYVLGLPVVFESYPGAHNWGWWMTNFLNPSLKLLGSRIWSNHLGLHPGDKYTQVITKEALTATLTSAQITESAITILEWSDQPLWKIYQNAMKKCAEIVLETLNLKVSFGFTTTEEICKEMGIWDISAKELARFVEASAGHAVVLFNKPDNSQISTDALLPDATVAELHQMGWWLGGAAIYRLIFSMGQNGGVVVMVKDSTQGRVNLIARDYMTEESGLFVAPVGLFRLSADEQNEDWSIDPLVLLEILMKWSEGERYRWIKEVWDAMEVPLQRQHIGKKTIARISQSGVKISVRDS